ncbi:TetR/AcrR family transcriptional regulator [Pontivivens ytuae]|uniref:TetR/AcrR family transcriptional regulator n=1 Tax=Pontivivens ytuae TaxID=2789856 RepID=A0A7S9LTS9_9RHOB|nr:TetR/AcrR family transcriptional regulator [Pontivivens ytuae]QPH54615.1 TetR/AcrR family transcriptional regulator [Pontivivens ytuae]
MVGIRKFDEAKLIKDAMRTFWARGAAATTMADLAMATGVQRGSLYNAYGDRETLLIAALDLYATRWRAQAVQALTDPEPEAAVAGFLQVHTDRMADPGNPPGCLMTEVSMELADLSEAVAQRVAMHFQQTEDALQAYFEAAQGRGALHPPLQPRPSARFVVATSRGMAVMHKAHGGRIDVVEDVAASASLLFRRPR